MRIRGILLGATKGVLWGVLGCVLMLVVVVIVVLEDRPDLKIWHTADLDAEFRAGSETDTFEKYLALEERLFAQLEERVCSKLEASDRSTLNRFNRGSMSDPKVFERDWNRTFELKQDQPKAAVLAVHGLSDSPYSVRAVATRMHAAGAWVVGLRLPGHGTAPVGLVDVEWEDWAAAYRLAARHLKAKVGDKPFYLVGFSTGAALAVEYSLAALDDDTLPRANGLLLMSPAIGVTPAAAMAVWIEGFGKLFGLRKFAWTDIGPPTDPFKYISFAVNAGHQIYRLTTEIRTGLAESDRLAEFPPVLAFQSAVDATVSIADLVSELMMRLPEAGHELVVFDINRVTEVEHLLKFDPRDTLLPLLEHSEPRFTLSAIVNENETSDRLVVRTNAAGQTIEMPLNLVWPRDVFSLSHVSLPFPPDDPVYGPEWRPDAMHVQIGAAALRGENGVIQIAPADMLRLRWNPFYSYMIRRMLAFTNLG
ncbi:MAG: alpha/beta hydrolase [Planctomycetota bacterium]|jgi:alpha-beta hydrolase superfamily lysophospholipase